MFFARVAAFTLACATASQAASVQRRQDIGDVIGGVVDDVTGGAASVFDQVTDAVGGGFEAATRFGDGVFERVTSFGGEAYTVVSQEGEEALTLITEGAGKVTLIGGQVVTVATSAFAEATNEAVNDDENAAGGLAPSVLIGVATTLGFSVLGAYITL
ncbi:hypothetical protein BDV98DRAFT_571230 [Pterulicium gracile]|uniref:Uncharacterized protein n=1 Tax=Pterulicium gracile TaxID=1884261 RepID=A0A5C3QC42_9AGAR|nr:hypothetical protein BDV98DRAFT_571230 [Pterula gracilis]